jgi:AraC-like DNA-binding protein
VYELRAPDPALAPFVEHYWFVRSTAERPLSVGVDAFVDARADLVFTLGNGYTRTVLGEKPVWCEASNLDAQRLCPIRIDQRGVLQLAGVRFRIGGLAPFAREELRWWTNQVVPVAEVFGHAGQHAHHALGRTEDVDSQAAILDRLLLESYRDSDGRSTFRQALPLAISAGARPSVEDLAEAADCSIRHLERLFAQHLGITPRTLLLITMFQSALQLLMTDPGCPLSDVAARTGFHDQPHLVRTFRRFSGGPPRDFRGYFPAGGPDDFAPNVVGYVQAEP